MAQAQGETKRGEGCVGPGLPPKQWPGVAAACRLGAGFLAAWLLLGAAGGATSPVPSQPSEGAEDVAMSALAPSDLVITPNHPTAFQRIDLRFRLPVRPENPFDPEEIDVQGVFTGPSGQRLVLPAFYDVVLSEGFQPVWRLRFSAPVAGRWSVQLEVKGRYGSGRFPLAQLEVAPGQHPGFVRVDPTGLGGFRLDNGEPFFPIGENMGWWNRGLEDYERWLGQLAAAGGNVIRVWLAEWTLALEGRTLGPGRFDVLRAQKLDQLLELADRLGVRVILVLNHHGQFSAETNPQWNENPYNRQNGGFLAHPAEFFRDPRAIELTKRRYRYLVARYAAYTSLMAWELWNEVDLTSGYRTEPVAAWHQALGSYLKATDPYQHPVTTSFSSPGRDPAIWQLPVIDFTNTHFYGAPDIAAATIQHVRDKLRLGKPTLIAEYGTDWRGPNGEADPTGIGLHNGLWASLVSGAAGSGMLWWWDNYVDPYQLYPRFASLSRFLQGVRVTANRRPVPARVTAPVAGVLRLSPNLGWGQQPASADYDLTGVTADSLPPVAEFLYGSRYNTHYRRPPRFTVQLGQPATFTVRVATSARAGGNLTVRLDGQVALSRDFAPAAADQPVDQALSISVPAGRHVIEVDNLGTDWLRLAGYELEGAGSRVRAWALQDGTTLIAWVQDSEHTWWRVREGYRPEPIAGAQLHLSALPAGRYRLTWWDTWAGQPLKVEAVAVTGGQGWQLPVPTFARDIALKVERVGG